MQCDGVAFRKITMLNKLAKFIIPLRQFLRVTENIIDASTKETAFTSFCDFKLYICI